MERRAPCKACKVKSADGAPPSAQKIRRPRIPPARARGRGVHAAPRLPRAQRVRGAQVRAAGAHLRAAAGAARGAAHRPGRRRGGAAPARLPGRRARRRVRLVRAQRRAARHRPAAVRVLGRGAAGQAHWRGLRGGRGRRGTGCGRRRALARAPGSLADRRHLPGRERRPRPGAARRCAAASRAGADRHRRPQVLLAPRLRSARARARRAQPVLGPGAGRQHAHAAAREELLPHARAHAAAQAHRARHGGAARAALRQERDPGDLSQRDLSRPGPRPRDPRRRPRGAVLLRQGGAVPHARRGRDAGRHGKGPGVLRSVSPCLPSAGAAQPRAARDARAGRDHRGAIRGRARRRSASAASSAWGHPPTPRS